MKKLHELTEEQAREICSLVGEPFISLRTNHDGIWTQHDEKGTLQIQINTTSTCLNNSDDSYIWIYDTGLVELWRNNGNWSGSRYCSINQKLVTNYLKSCGYLTSDNELRTKKLNRILALTDEDIKLLAIKEMGFDVEHFDCEDWDRVDWFIKGFNSCLKTL
jgi:hypothetical protein